MKDLVVIDSELINRLRRQGEGYKAAQLLEAYQRNKKENRQQEQKLIFNQSRKKVYRQRKNQGSCVDCGDELKQGFNSNNKPFIYCDYHYELRFGQKKYEAQNGKL